MFKQIKNVILVSGYLLLLQACDRDVGIESADDTVLVSEPDEFSLFLNPQYSLSGVEYKVIATTNTVGETGAYELVVNNGNEELLRENSSWNISTGQDTDPVNHTGHVYSFKLKQTGAVRISLESSSADSYLYLLDENNNVLLQTDNGGSANNALIDLPERIWNSQVLADAYYEQIDPLNERLTLNAWKTKNGFGSGTGVEYQLSFRDTKDLGYGRKMYFRQNDDSSIAVYVENYQFAGVDGLQYGLLNLEALVNNDQRHHFGSNAIEWSPPEGGGEMFAKFYTFKADPEDASADEVRISVVDLDGRGDKAMPGVCIVCHGGDDHALEDDGTFSNAGNTHSKLHMLEPDTFDFSEQPGLTRADQESILKNINEIILSTYPAVQVAGEWDSAFSIEMAEGWYGGTGLPDSEFDGEYVPLGWRPDADTGNPPAGADELFLKVVKPSCLACHSKRGSDLRSDISFSSYDDFISYADTIEEYVYERGLMPLALLPYNNFWNSSNPSQPELLASHLQGFSHANADGSIDRPGKPVSKPGSDRRVNGDITLTAEASVFFETVNWQVLSTPSLLSVYSFDTNTSPIKLTSNDLRPTFSADEDGEYVIQLTVTNDQGESDSASLIITLDSTLPLTRSLTFETDIKPIIQGTMAPLTSCITCHTDDPLVLTAISGIPVLYTDGPELYHHVLERVNLKNVERSRFLKKPTGDHHFGGLQLGYDTAGDSTHFNTVLNWIIEGAREQ